MSWVKTISYLTQGQVIAIDGKTLRRSHNQATGKRAIHIVSAWAPANHLVLGQIKTERTSTGGVKARRKRAGWDETYLLKVLSQ